MKLIEKEYTKSQRRKLKKRMAKFQSNEVRRKRKRKFRKRQQKTRT